MCLRKNVVGGWYFFPFQYSYVNMMSFRKRRCPKWISNCYFHEKLLAHQYFLLCKSIYQSGFSTKISTNSQDRWNRGLPCDKSISQQKLANGIPEWIQKGVIKPLSKGVDHKTKYVHLTMEISCFVSEQHFPKLHWWKDVEK